MNWPAWPLLPENLSSTTNIDIPLLSAVFRAATHARLGWALSPALRARIQPGAHRLDFLPDEPLVAKGVSQRGDPLAPGQKVHREFVGVGLAAEQRELPAQPDPKQREQLVG